MTVTAMSSLTPYHTALAHLPGHGHDWTESLRLRALRAFETRGFPSTHEEAWKYTRLHQLAKALPPLLVDVSDGDYQLPQAEIEGLDCYVLPVVNGRIITGISDRYNLPEGARLSLLSECLNNPEPWLMEKLEDALADPSDSLDLLNLALAADGWVLTLDENTLLDKPLHIRYLNHLQSDHSLMLRHFLIAGAGAKAHIIESFAGTNTHPYWQDSRTHLHLGDHAELTHTLLQEQGGQATHTQAAYAALQHHASYRQQFVNLGARTGRHELHGHIHGEQAECRVTGIYLGHDSQTLDHYLPVIHHAPRSHSEQTVKGVLDGTSRGVFYGSILVPEHAAGTEAHQQSRVLLMSEGAEADNRPELRILTDEVQCSHGAAIGDLDADALYYLMARGLPERDARAMLVEGFVMDVLDTAALPDALHAHLRERILTRLQEEGTHAS